nr:discoidin domain-containing protein [Acetatifactor sp.]
VIVEKKEKENLYESKKTMCCILSLLLCVGSIALPSKEVHAQGTPSLLHTDGNRIVNAQGEQITLRGTNLGGWLMQEGWLSPLGSGELDHSFITQVIASCSNGSHTAEFSNDTTTANGITTNNLSTYWQSDCAQGNDNMELKIVLDKARTFDTIVVETDPDHTGDYLRGGIVWISTDGSSDWHQVTDLTIDESKVQSGIVTIKTGEQTAKYIAVKPSRASEYGQYWAVGNISLCMSDEYSVRNNLIRRFGETQANQLIGEFQSHWITSEDIAHIASMNMNFVRVPVYWMDFALKDGTLRSDSNSGFAKLDWLLNECAQYGIYVLIDFHGAPGGANGWASSGQAGTIPTELFVGDANAVDWNRQVTLNIWAALSDRYKNNPTVAAYGLLNEPVLSFSPDDHLDGTKYWFYNEIYNTVRTNDPNHIVIFEEFGDWSIAQNRPERQNWTNYMFEKHPYDMSNATSWDSQKALANNTVSTLSNIQQTWNIPILAGEFCLYYFNDVWDDFLSDMNRNKVSWTNWCYKVRGTKFEGGGGNWGYYNNYTGAEPDIMHDSYAQIASIWAGTGTSTSFSANTPLINIVSARADGSTNYPYVALSRNNWSVSATNTNSSNPVSYMIDGSTDTMWSSGTLQASGQSITVDFGQAENYDKIEMLSSGEDYPGYYKVEKSDDGINFTEVVLNNVDIGFGAKMVLLPAQPERSRYLRITLTGSKDKWWAMKELNVYWRNVS